VARRKSNYKKIIQDDGDLYTLKVDLTDTLTKKCISAK